MEDANIPAHDQEAALIALRLIAEAPSWRTPRSYKLRKEHLPEGTRITVKRVRAALLRLERLRVLRAERRSFEDWIALEGELKHAAFKRWLARRWRREKGFPTPFADRKTTDASGNSLVSLLDVSFRPRAVLYHLEGWVGYSRRESWYTSATELILYDDDSGSWRAVRVARDVRTVQEALDWLKPEAVRRAEREGRRVLRQGDVYLVEKRRGPVNAEALADTRHELEETPRGWRLVHPEHAPLEVDFPFRAYLQRSGYTATARGD